MVSALEGQLTRTWFFANKNRNHVINLYHDTISGLRSVMIDFQEVPGSTGNSSVFIDSNGHRIYFKIDDLPGYVEIKKAGWIGFNYSCVVNDRKLFEATEQVASNQNDVFRVKIVETTFTQDELSEHPIAWYLVKVMRIKDNVTTNVHRRFRDFADLNSQVKQNFKGHHLRQTLPPLPEKPSKMFTDHRDPAFIQERSAKLEIFLTALIAVPHVSDMICVKAFLGIMDQVKEFSLSFHVPTIGMSLTNGDKPDDSSPAYVGVIQKPEICEGVQPGDSISKINGLPVTGLTFDGVVARIKILPRPIIIHFVQVLAHNSNSKNHSKIQKDLPTFSQDRDSLEKKILDLQLTTDAHQDAIEEENEETNAISAQPSQFLAHQVNREENSAQNPPSQPNEIDVDEIWRKNESVSSPQEEFVTTPKESEHPDKSSQEVAKEESKQLETFSKSPLPLGWD